VEVNLQSSLISEINTSAIATERGSGAACLWDGEGRPQHRC